MVSIPLLILRYSPLPLSFLRPPTSFLPSPPPHLLNFLTFSFLFSPISLLLKLLSSPLSFCPLILLFFCAFLHPFLSPPTPPLCIPLPHPLFFPLFTPPPPLPFSHLFFLLYLSTLLKATVVYIQQSRKQCDIVILP